MFWVNFWFFLNYLHLGNLQVIFQSKSEMLIDTKQRYNRSQILKPLNPLFQKEKWVLLKMTFFLKLSQNWGRHLQDAFLGFNLWSVRKLQQNGNKSKYLFFVFNVKNVLKSCGLFSNKLVVVQSLLLKTWFIHLLFFVWSSNLSSEPA